MDVADTIGTTAEQEDCTTQDNLFIKIDKLVLMRLPLRPSFPRQGQHDQQPL